jgi:transcriptional regulator with XRE-family HTH domain
MSAAVGIPGLDRYADVARAAGIDPSTLSKWWRGMRPTPDSLDRLAAALCLTATGRAGLYTVCGYTAPPGRGGDPLAAAIAALIAPDSPVAAEVRRVLAQAIAPFTGRAPRTARVA